MNKIDINELIEKYTLSENQNKEILNTKILPLVFNFVYANDNNPKAIVLGGQTGSR